MTDHPAPAVSKEGGVVERMALTRAQKHYLETIIARGSLSKGWGGMSSATVVRRLEELGLIRLSVYPGGHWKAAPTDAGCKLVGKSKRPAEEAMTRPASGGREAGERPWRDSLDDPPPQTPRTRIYVKSIEVYRYVVRGSVGRWQRMTGIGYVEAELPTCCEWMHIPIEGSDHA